MKTIAIINLKGGVGKTTTAVNLAAILADAGKRVLVIDADPQANATQFFLPYEEAVNSLATVMEGLAADPYDFIYETGIPGVDLLPGSIELINADIASVKSGAGYTRIDDFLDALEEDAEVDTAGAYDFCIIDCPPSFTAASVAAIYASDRVIVPVTVDYFSVAGMSQLLAQIKSVQRVQPFVEVAGVLITQWHNVPACVQGESVLRESGVPVFDTVIRRSEKVAEAGFKRQSLIEYSPQSAAARDYRTFADELLEVI